MPYADYVWPEWASAFLEPYVLYLVELKLLPQNIYPYFYFLTTLSIIILLAVLPSYARFPFLLLFHVIFSTAWFSQIILLIITLITFFGFFSRVSSDNIMGRGTEIDINPIRIMICSVVLMFVVYIVVKYLDPSVSAEWLTVVIILIAFFVYLLPTFAQHGTSEGFTKVVLLLIIILFIIGCGLSIGNSTLMDFIYRHYYCSGLGPNFVEICIVGKQQEAARRLLIMTHFRMPVEDGKFMSELNKLSDAKSDDDYMKNINQDDYFKPFYDFSQQLQRNLPYFLIPITSGILEILLFTGVCINNIADNAYADSVTETADRRDVASREVGYWVVFRMMLNSVTAEHAMLRVIFFSLYYVIYSRESFTDASCIFMGALFTLIVVICIIREKVRQAVSRVYSVRGTLVISNARRHLGTGDETFFRFALVGVFMMRCVLNYSLSWQPLSALMGFGTLFMFRGGNMRFSLTVALVSIVIGDYISAIAYTARFIYYINQEDYQDRSFMTRTLPNPDAVNQGGAL